MLLCYISLGRRKQNLLTANNDRTAQDEKLEAYSWLMPASACATNINYLLNRTNYAKMLCATLNLNSVVMCFFLIAYLSRGLELLVLLALPRLASSDIFF